jgi:HK97 gp10 family phage protein
MSITIELHMEPALRAALDSAPRMIEAAMREAMLDVGMDIANDARPRAPFVTGSLRRSIQVKERDGEILVGSDLPYAARIEYGFRGTDSRGRSYNQPPQPYLRPAFDENRNRARQAMADALVAALRRIA